MSTANLIREWILQSAREIGVDVDGDMERMQRGDSVIPSPKQPVFCKRRILPQLIQRDGLRCHYCGCQLFDSSKTKGLDKSLYATIDHKQPRSRGGAITDLSNLVIACSHCNSSKSTKTYAEFKR